MGSSTAQQLHAQQGQASAQAYAKNAITFAMKYHQVPQPAVSQRSPQMSQGRWMVRCGSARVRGLMAMG
ncbi:MAG: hypothetical protein MH252_09750 [Thermosynechococcaceae cyanobacterium MS004]|nr:hypothetical protein [Thermosynechococcaceae cyanobacterium MS004]